MPLEPRDRARLTDMLAFAQDAVELLSGRSLADIEHDKAARYSLVRCLEVIGEAANSVSANTREGLDTIPWRSMWNMRNRLIHDYGNTNYTIVHSVVATELPKLIAELETILGPATG